MSAADSCPVCEAPVAPVATAPGELISCGRCRVQFLPSHSAAVTIHTEAGGAPPQRIGLSATVRPVETAARLLVGAARPLPAIVNVGLPHYVFMVRPQVVHIGCVT